MPSGSRRRTTTGGGRSTALVVQARPPLEPRPPALQGAHWPVTHGTPLQKGYPDCGDPLRAPQGVAIHPEWLLQQSHGARHSVAVHVGGCHMAGKYTKPLERDQAVRALADGIEACSHCRPDTALGLLDG